MNFTSSAFELFLMLCLWHPLLLRKLLIYTSTMMYESKKLINSIRFQLYGHVLSHVKSLYLMILASLYQYISTQGNIPIIIHHSYLVFLYLLILFSVLFVIYWLICHHILHRHYILSVDTSWLTPSILWHYWCGEGVHVREVSKKPHTVVNTRLR